jgi:mono/diheme cytochrome c family protein
MRLDVFLIALLAVIAHASKASASGEELYAEHCAACHGERLVATGAVPDLRSYGADKREKFDKMMSEGRGQMPSWEGVLSEAEQNEIWLYIRSRAR